MLKRMMMSKLYERYMIQKENEDYQTFVQRIRLHVDDCAFENKERVEEEIVDRVMFGTGRIEPNATERKN